MFDTYGRKQILFDIFSKPKLLSEDPKPEELFKFLFRPIRTKRLRKKFLKNLDKKAPHYVQPQAWQEYQIKRWAAFGAVISEHVREVLARPSFSRRILTISFDLP